MQRICAHELSAIIWRMEPHYDYTQIRETPPLEPREPFKQNDSPLIAVIVGLSILVVVLIIGIIIALGNSKTDQLAQEKSVRLDITTQLESERAKTSKLEQQLAGAELDSQSLADQKTELKQDQEQLERDRSNLRTRETNLSTRTNKANKQSETVKNIDNVLNTCKTNLDVLSQALAANQPLDTTLFEDCQTASDQIAALE